MKATEQMIDAVCEASPTVPRENVTKMVQAALLADPSISRVELVDFDQQMPTSEHFCRNETSRGSQNLYNAGNRTL